MNRLLLPILACFSSLLLTSPGYAGQADDLVLEGDRHDQKLESRAALTCYLPAEKLTPDSVPLLLRIARQYRHEMQDAPSDSGKKRLAALSKQYAERAVALSPDNGEAHLSVAISHAKSLSLLSSKEKMLALRVVKMSADRAIALDPDQDLAWYVLGCWNQRVTELSGLKRKMAEMIYGDLPAADDATAVKCFRKAIALNPGRLTHYIELGRTYAHMGNDAEAKKMIRKGLAMINTGKDDPESKQRGLETMAGLK